MAAAPDQRFSHQRHAPLKLACTTCHTGAETKDIAGFPALSQCQLCHQDASAKIPSRRIFRQPDFVLFRHSVHVLAKVECRSCHGDVWRQASFAGMEPMKMKACVDCHKARHATEVCNACHELGQ
ncbi:MAG: cytochrome c3 family protein [Acidobacteria bacterium]|nr:cytochrome c3 family protein [Acidobacteriota bacterium]